jgi:hypothetical protein
VGDKFNFKILLRVSDFCAEPFQARRFRRPKHIMKTYEHLYSGLACETSELCVETPLGVAIYPTLVNQGKSNALVTARTAVTGL